MENLEHKFPGFCPICLHETTFVAADAWYRDSLNCTRCEGGSLPRHRALALVLGELRPDWRRERIHESSPSPGGLSAAMAAQCRRYLATHYFPDIPPGGYEASGIRCENLERQTFADGEFDIVLTQDVMEHVFDPGAAYREIHRTLKGGGLYLHTFPMRKWMSDAIVKRAELGSDGVVIHLTEPEYHGNPIDAKGVLVTHDYGYDVHQWIAQQANFDVRVYRFNDARHGILGEYLDVVACFKR